MPQKLHIPTQIRGRLLPFRQIIFFNQMSSFLWFYFLTDFKHTSHSPLQTHPNSYVWNVSKMSKIRLLMLYSDSFTIIDHLCPKPLGQWTVFITILTFLCNAFFFLVTTKRSSNKITNISMGFPESNISSGPSIKICLLGETISLSQGCLDNATFKNSG